MYAVTNRHVTRKADGSAAAPVIRINTQAGGIDVRPLTADNCVVPPDGDDLAVAHLGGFDLLVVKFAMIPMKMFLTKQLVTELEIGPGDETFMVGRFVDHEGRQRNLPSVRFGNISMMPQEPIRHPLGHDQESFVVEARSLAGYSGSPVFVHIIPGTGRPSDGVGVLVVGGATGPWLLGVDWGHVPVKQTVKVPTGEEWLIELNAGQMAVVPAWRLMDLLYSGPLVELRKQIDAKRASTGG